MVVAPVAHRIGYFGRIRPCLCAWCSASFSILEITEPFVLGMSSLIVRVTLHRPIQQCNDSDPDEINYRQTKAVTLRRPKCHTAVWKWCREAMPVMAGKSTRNDREEMDQAHVQYVVGERDTSIDLRGAPQPGRAAGRDQRFAGRSAFQKS